MQFQAVKCAKKECTCKVCVWGLGEGGRDRSNICSNSSKHHVKTHFVKFVFSYSSIEISSPPSPIIIQSLYNAHFQIIGSIF